MVKRAPFVVGATIAGVAGVLTFHSRATTQLTNTLPVTAGKSGQGGGKGGATTTTAPPSGAQSSAPATASEATATGAAEQYGYGVLSVKVTVRGTKIVDVGIANLQTAESYSQQIAVEAVPYLRRQVLDAQGSRINGLSGATYTSEAYALSVQSALDKLHVK